MLIARLQQRSAVVYVLNIEFNRVSELCMAMQSLVGSTYGRVVNLSIDLVNTTPVGLTNCFGAREFQFWRSVTFNTMDRSNIVTGNFTIRPTSTFFLLFPSVSKHCLSNNVA